MRVISLQQATQRPFVLGRANPTLSTPRRSLQDSNWRVCALPEPSDARGAIQIGLSLTDAGDYVAALPYFEQALELPGTGLKRYRDKPNLISNGEKMAALYNIACCQSQMAKLAAAENDDEKKEECIANGLVALAGALEAGMDDYATLRGDTDLDMLRGEKFDRLTGAFEKKSRGLFGNLFS